jgi:hypothetical protein
LPRRPAVGLSQHFSQRCNRNRRNSEIVKSRIGHLKSRISKPLSFVLIGVAGDRLWIEISDSRFLMPDFKISEIVASVHEVDPR